MSNESIRTAIWNEMVDADRLARYYGALAGRKANVERWMAILTTLLALISFALASQGVGGWVILSTGLTVLTSAVPPAPRPVPTPPAPGKRRGGWPPARTPPPRPPSPPRTAKRSPR